MASFEEEALRRAQQMHSRPPHQTEREKKPKPPEKKPEDTPQKTDNKQDFSARRQRAKSDSAPAAFAFRRKSRPVAFACIDVFAYVII